MTVAIAAGTSTGSSLLFFTGVHADTKPLVWHSVSVNIGSGFLETDTDDLYLLFPTNWVRVGGWAGALSALALTGQLSAGLLASTRVKARVLSVADATATPSLDTDNYDEMEITAQAEAITSFTTHLTGTPNDGDTLRISITDNGTDRAITWGSGFEASTVSLPTTTATPARLDTFFVWNPATSKWRCILVA